MANLIIYGYPASTFVRTARMACVEKGVPHELDAFESFGFRSEEHRQLHPFAKMPIMRHDDVTLCETLAICCYIDATFDGPGLMPEKLADRCRMFQWISLTNDAIYQHLVRKWIRPLLMGPEPDESSRTGMRNAARDALACVEDRCDGDYLVSSNLSLADLFLAPILACAVDLDEDFLAGLPRLANFWAEMSSRQSFANTISEAPVIVEVQQAGERRV
ncbi:MAG: glutathione S-transferase family protein [Gammaproteobacteria bacterium]|nr:glutathione S-transferase family protein [Gammaproteobacteria bacterium]